MNTFPTLVGLNWDIKKRVFYSNTREESASGASFTTMFWPATLPHYEFDMVFEYLSQSDRDTLEAFYRGQCGTALPFLLPVTNDNALSNLTLGIGNGVNVSAQVPGLPAQTNVTTSTITTQLDWQGVRTCYPYARANLVKYSEQIDNAAWVNTGTTDVANAVAAPDGNTTADKLIEDSSTGSHYITSAATTTIAAGSTVVSSIYAKELGAGAKRYLSLQFNTSVFGGANNGAIFDCSGAGAVTAVVGGAVSASITSIGGGWYRCSITTAPANNSTTFAVRPRLLTQSTNYAETYTGDGASGMYLWGAQAEVSSVMTGYIPTTSAAASFTDYTITATGAIIFAIAPANTVPYVFNGNYAYVVQFKDDGLEFGYLWNYAYKQEGITFRTFR